LRLLVLLSHRIRLYETYFRRACGIRRFAYNWALTESKRLHEAEEKTSGYDLVKRFNAIKAERFPWTGEVSK
jgi:putative transposase